MNPLAHREERSLNGNQKRPLSSNLGDDANQWTKRLALSTPSDKTSVPGNIDTDSSHTYLSNLTVDTPTTHKTPETTTTWRVEGNVFPYSGDGTTQLTKTSSSILIDQQRVISNSERVSHSGSHLYAGKHAQPRPPAKGCCTVELPIVATASEAEANATASDNNRVSRDSSRVSIFQISSLGATCTICQTSVGTSDSAISHHLKTHHASLRTTIKNLSELARNVRSNLESAKKVSGCIPLQETLMFKCPTCNRAYKSMQAFCNHRRKSKDAACLNTHAIKTTTSLSTSPGLNASNPRGKNDQTSNPFPKPTFLRIADFASAQTILSRHIRDNESVELYIPLFTPFIGGMTDFDTDIFQRLTSCCPKILTSDSKHLPDILDQAEKWLMERARYEVSMIPANLRAALLKFDYQDIGEVTHNLTFTFRHKEEVLLNELKKLLSFLWRSRSPLIAQFHQSYHKDDLYFVQRLLVACLLEKIDNIHSHPLLVQYCLVRCFKGTSPEKLSMIQAGDVSSICSTVLSILRSSVCSVICTFEQSLESRAEVLIRDTQRSRTLNTLAPMIRRLREVQQKKPSNPKDRGRGAERYNVQDSS